MALVRGLGVVWMNPTGVKQQLRKPRGSVLVGPLEYIPYLGDGAAFKASLADWVFRLVTTHTPYAPIESVSVSAAVSVWVLRETIVRHTQPPEDSANVSASISDFSYRVVVIPHVPPPEDRLTIAASIGEFEFENPVIRTNADPISLSISASIEDFLLNED